MPSNERPQAKPSTEWWLVFLLVAVLINVFVRLLVPTQERRSDIPYSPGFVQQVEAGNVEEVTSNGRTIEGTFERPVKSSDADASQTEFRTEVPTYADGDALEDLLVAHGVKLTAEKPSSGSFGRSLVSLLPLFLGLMLVFFLLRRMGGGAGAMGFGKARARRVEPSQQLVRFADVAGVDEAKLELSQVVDVLRDPDRYRRLGARTPRGVLLTGPPGTGKTLLAKAVAGEAEVPFFSIAASEFVELFVGVGASRVRDLFAQAKAAAPAILFIDELDAIGRARGPSSFSGGHEEREQTLNQILAEMDGFDARTGVIVLSATNRPEVLDRALLRPGRFDRQIALEPPDQRGRAAILRVHTHSVPLADDVDLDELAITTPGMVGADLANLVNEAALLAARRDAKAVENEDLARALDRLVLGSERRIVMSDADRARTAFHESGHALVGMLTPGADPVRKVSIIPHGKTLGVTLAAPIADRFSYDAAYLRGKLDVLHAGQAAEALMCDGDVSTGAENDLREATEIARHMAGSWGMSERFGTMTVLHDDDQAIAYPSSVETSEDTRRVLDEEVRRMLRESRARAEELLRAHRASLQQLAAALLVHETLDAAAAAAAVAEGAEIQALPAGTVDPRGTTTSGQCA